MDDKKQDLWHTPSRPPSASSHLSSAQPPMHVSISPPSTTLSQHFLSQHHPHRQQPHQLQPTLQQQQQASLLYPQTDPHSDPHPSPRMVTALQSRGIGEEAPGPGATLAPSSFSGLPLLDAGDHVLPPILPAKRTYGSEDIPASSTTPVTTDWAHVPQQNKVRAMPGLPRSTGSLPGAFSMGRNPNRSGQAEAQTGLHAGRPGSMGSAPSEMTATRLAGVANYALQKHSEALYGTDTTETEANAFQVDTTKHAMHESLSRPLGYGDALGVIPGGSGQAPFLPPSVSGGVHSYLPSPGGSSRGRRVSPCDDSFVIAAETGAQAQCAVDNASGDGTFETYELGINIVQSSKLYANQRRSNRLLPGGSDSTTAACYMIGGTPDSVLSPLLARVSPCDPREERCKAVERVLKDKTRGAICALNGENPREARADNLAAVRICEVVADILVAFSSKRLFESRKQLFQTVTRQEAMIKDLREQLDEQKRETERWRKEVGGDTGGVGGSERDGTQMGMDGGDEREERRGVAGEHKEG